MNKPHFFGALFISDVLLKTLKLVKHYMTFIENLKEHSIYLLMRIYLFVNHTEHKTGIYVIIIFRRPKYCHKNKKNI